MADVSVYNQEGKEIEKLSLSKKIFEQTINPGLLHEAVTLLLANRRAASAHTKSRAEVSGGGKKPWRQKGTGRARAGSSRSPLWRGGGITFGPRNDRNYTKKMNAKAQQKAVAMALTDKVLQKKFIVLDTLEIPEGKTKGIIGMLKKLPSLRSVLFVTSGNHGALVQATRNLPQADTAAPRSLNTYDILSHDGIITTKEAVAVIEARFSKLS